MPRFEKLSESEVEQLRRRRVPMQNLSEYSSFLDTLKPGEWGEVILEPNETQRAIKRRLTTAAKQKGLEIKYKKGPEGRIIFEVKQSA